jgi:hypothetical protein
VFSWRCFVKYPNSAERGCVPAYSSRATADYNVAGAFGNHTNCIYADSHPKTDTYEISSAEQQACAIG